MGCNKRKRRATKLEEDRADNNNNNDDVAVMVRVCVRIENMHPSLVPVAPALA